MNAAAQQLELTWPETEYQPRYKAYCAAHGREPVAMLAHDKVAWPGGQMCGYILWIGYSWRKWRKTKDYSASHVLSDIDHAEFDEWLAANSETPGQS